MTVPSTRVLSACRAPLPFARTWSKRSMTSPPSKLRAPKRESAGKTNELSEFVLERVLLDLEPDEAQRVRRVVGVAQRHLAAQRFAGGVERRREIVVGALLPVLRSGRAGAAAILVAGRQVERREHRRVANAGAIESRTCRRGARSGGGLANGGRGRGPDEGHGQQAARDASSCKRGHDRTKLRED